MTTRRTFLTRLGGLLGLGAIGGTVKALAPIDTATPDPVVPTATSGYAQVVGQPSPYSGSYTFTTGGTVWTYYPSARTSGTFNASVVWPSTP